MSHLYGIGVGPGDSELITLKAVRILETLDILVTPTTKCGSDSLALSIAKPFLKEDLVIYERVFPMSLDSEVLTEAWDKVADEIREAVLSGKRVGFITLGDPMTYSTYIYLLVRLKGHMPITTVPGITSYQGLSASVGIPLVEGDTPLVIAPCTLPLEKLKDIILNNDSVVLMKLSKQFKEVLAFLIEEGLDDCSKLVSFATQKDEKIYQSLSEVIEPSISYFSTILINKRWRQR
jgi:sirohydrochlorin cobaltochelatase